VSPPDASTPDSERPGERKYPLFVRVLAVVYVLTLGVQIIGFLILAGIGAVLFGMRRQVDGWVAGFALAGIACFVLCAAYRWWYPYWWEKRYPPAGGKKADGDERRPSP
jgi:amino acid transporter